MIELITKTEYTDFRTKSDGILSGKLKVKVHTPELKQKAKIVDVLTEHFIVTVVDIPSFEDPETTVPTEVPVLLANEKITYRMEEFDELIKQYNISYDISTAGITGAIEYAFSQLSVALVKSGGSKNKGTFGVDPNDWEITQ